MTQLERKLAALPDQPGVYLWKGADGTVLYVGKAKSLKQRVASYLGAAAGESPKLEHLMRRAADVDTIVVATEAQALLLENTLIKEHRPRYNVLLRDDKSYPAIAVTLGEPFPRVLVVRRVSIPGARFFGPYTDVSRLRQTLRIIRRIFTVRSCHYALPGDAPDRPCLDYHIARCRAPCVGYQSEADYRRMIDDVVAFLEGKTVEVRARLRERMREASERLDFERAAELRDALTWLEQLERPPVVERVGGGSADVIGYARDDDEACGVVLRVRDGRVVAREYRFLEQVDEPDGDVLAAYLARHYLGLDERAPRVLLPFPPSDLEAFQALEPSIEWRSPQRGPAQRLVALAEQNAIHLLESLRLEALETEERAEDPVYAVGRDLGLTSVPRAIATIDVSTNQGRDTVGSVVWFEGGRPKKSEYRRYRIRAPEGQQDDYAAVSEVVARLLSRRLSEGRPLPDLLVIDGGKGQLGAALAAAEAAGCRSLPIASLAKREEAVFLPGRNEPLRLSRRSTALKLLQRGRDEAHRFAVAYSRQRRSRRTITSELLNIPGVGPTRRRALLERFGSLAGVRTATAAEIASLPGFSGRLADRVLSHLAGRS